jgi:hypothetical protein
VSQNKKILLTFDYEPFLGMSSGSAKSCMLEPTEALRVILKKNAAKAIFFIDTFYLFNLQKHPELVEDHQKITAQIKQLYSEGHYIFPHIHPHWKDAVYHHEKKEFSLGDLTNYSLANLPKGEIRSHFNDSIRFLKEIGISYEKWGYRAGGWCIQPFSMFKDIFLEKNIAYEFSVLPGYKNENARQAFDFTSVKTYTPYYFTESVETPEEKGSFIEFPISSLHFTSRIKFTDRLVRKYLWKKGDHGWGKGTSAQTDRLRSVLTEKEMASIELLTIAKLRTYKKHLEDNAYMHWISHPKMFTRHGLKMFDSFLSFATNTFSPTFDFLKMIPVHI